MGITSNAELLVETLPHVIENDEQYDEIRGRAAELVGKQRRRSPEETRLMRLLLLLVEDYDRRQGLPPANDT